MSLNNTKKSNITIVILRKYKPLSIIAVFYNLLIMIPKLYNIK